MMIRTPVLLAAAIIAGLAMSQSAEARRVQLERHYTKAQIKAACDAAGVTESVEGSTYGCEVQSQGTSVYCNNSECWGYVPESSKIANTGLATTGQATKEPPLSALLKGQ